MALLGDLEAAERQLRAMPDARLNADASARLADIQVAVTSYIEERTGRVFGEAAVEESLAVQAPTRSTIAGVYGASALLLLPRPIRAISSVLVGAAWSGTGWTGGEEIAATAYRPALLTSNGDAMALESVDGLAWYGRYVVTGIYAGAAAGEDVPADITYVANLMIAEMFKYEQSSAGAQSGPEGAVLPLKNSTKHPVVAAILNKYAVDTEDLVV